MRRDRRRRVRKPDEFRTMGIFDWAQTVFEIVNDLTGKKIEN